MYTSLSLSILCVKNILNYSFQMDRALSLLGTIELAQANVKYSPEFVLILCGHNLLTPDEHGEVKKASDIIEEVLELLGWFLFDCSDFVF